MRALLARCSVMLMAALATACEKVTEPTRFSQPSYLPTPPPTDGPKSVPTRQQASTVAQGTSSTLRTTVTLAPIAEGRYLPGYFNQGGFNSIGQGQAGWLAFDISQLTGSQICGLRLGFTQAGTTNAQYFPLTINIYDITTSFDRLNVDRIPIDAEGEEIASDLHSGRLYSSFQAGAGDGTVYEIALNDFAVSDLQNATDQGDQVFSVAFANVSFDNIGYFSAVNANLQVSVGCVMEVSIDIKPGSEPSPLNTISKGTIPVAILSGPGFDATQELDRESLTFGRTGDEGSLNTCTKGNEDVNGDFYPDVMCHFFVSLSGFVVGDVEGVLKGKTMDGTPIEGRDAVRIIK